jgi:uncharacterized damage-inducible protein DinB
MPLRDSLLQELDLEGAYTRKYLERVPMTTLGYRPQSKSMSLGELATFLAVIPTWGEFALTTESFDVAPGGVPLPQTEVVRSRPELLELFDKNLSSVRGALAKVSDARLGKPWSLVADGNAIFTQQRHLVFRTFFFNHLIHHRGQLSVYFRLLGVPVPAVYNDSGDERGGMFIDSAGPSTEK